MRHHAGLAGFISDTTWLRWASGTLYFGDVMDMKPWNDDVPPDTKIASNIKTREDLEAIILKMAPQNSA
ncbi:hypothetical protein [Anatilimnocola aggregata]|uniref:hypothetical protein n=1 Tax=Anatilimnocola aggregata TaxID=2528021 RepID=UPI00119F4471|nr:hypothetical protein [Anatilimnocola aggregata]